MSDGYDTSRYDALDPLAQRYVDVAAKKLYLIDHCWDEQPDSGYWEQLLEGSGGEEGAWIVGEYRIKALKVVEALAAVTKASPAIPPEAKASQPDRSVDLTKMGISSVADGAAKASETVSA